MQEMMRCKPCTLMKRMQNEYKQPGKCLCRYYQEVN